MSACHWFLVLCLRRSSHIAHTFMMMNKKKIVRVWIFTCNMRLYQGFQSTARPNGEFASHIRMSGHRYEKASECDVHPSEEILREWIDTCNISHFRACKWRICITYKRSQIWESQGVRRPSIWRDCRAKAVTTCNHPCSNTNQPCREKYFTVLYSNNPFSNTNLAQLYYTASPAQTTMHCNEPGTAKYYKVQQSTIQ